MLVRAIAGVLEMNANEAAINKMILSMERRAKGAAIVYTSGGYTLLSRDGDNGDEGIVSVYWAGEKYTICFDGRIYNKNELYGQLIKKGFPLIGKSDEEIMLFSYICWREEMMKMINGEFASVILCERENRVFLVRDRMGINPLFYLSLNEGIIFASEIKTILAFPGVEPQLDVQGISELLLLGPGRIPGNGVFRGIFEIKPGFFGIYQDGNLKLHRYWQLRDHIHEDDFEKTAEKVRSQIYDSVRNHLTAQTSVGTMLSGGLDSSIISAICARECDAKDQQLHTFSLDYKNNTQFFLPGRFQPDSDTQYIQIMQEALDSHHHWTILTPEDLVEGLQDAMIARDLPGMADVDSSLLSFIKSIKPYSSVVLSGECADELFCGYPWYRDADMRDIIGFPWANTLNERARFLQGWILDQINPKEFVLDHYYHTIHHADILPENSPQDKRMKELMNLNISWFMQTLLERGERMGSHYGVDIRVPFCDYKIAEYAYSIPWTFKDYKGREKGLLRECMRGLLPDAVLFRKKSPFPKTHDPHYLELVSNLLKEVIQDKQSRILQIVKPESLEVLLSTDFSWPWYGQLMQRPQIIAYMLQINLWLKHYSLHIV